MPHWIDQGLDLNDAVAAGSVAGSAGIPAGCEGGLLCCAVCLGLIARFGLGRDSGETLPCIFLQHGLLECVTLSVSPTRRDPCPVTLVMEFAGLPVQFVKA